MKIFQINYSNYFNKTNVNSGMATDDYSFISKNKICDNQNDYFDKSLSLTDKREIANLNSAINFLGRIKKLPAEYESKVIEMYKSGVRIGEIMKMLPESIKIKYNNIYYFLFKQNNVAELLQEHKKNKRSASAGNKNGLIDTCLELLAKGLSIDEIAREVKLARCTIYQYLNGNQEIKEKVLQARADNRSRIVDEALEMLSEGYFLKEVAGKLHLHPMTLSKYITERTNVGSERKLTEDEMISSIMEMTGQGKSLDDIAKELNLPKYIILKHLKSDKSVYKTYNDVKIKYIIAEVQKMTKKGCLLEEISKKLNIEVEEILRYLHTDKKQYRKFLHAKIERMFKDGYTIEEVAKECNYSKFSLFGILYDKNNRKLLKLYNECKKSNSGFYEKQELILKLHKQGASPDKIAKQVGFSSPTVAKIIRESFATQEEYEEYINTRKNDLREDFKNRVNALFAQGLTKKEIAKILGCSERKVQYSR